MRIIIVSQDRLHYYNFDKINSLDIYDGDIQRNDFEILGEYGDDDLAEFVLDDFMKAFQNEYTYPMIYFMPKEEQARVEMEYQEKKRPAPVNGDETPF